MRRLLRCIVVAALAVAPSAAQTPLSSASAVQQLGARVEGRSKDLLAVGVVHGGKMSIHISRITDNAPVRDAFVTVVLRGTAHPTTAETDGSYSLESPDLTLPGAATVEFQVNEGAVHESLKGTLAGAQGDQPRENNGARQLWWWVLNFSVCFGVLWLISRRRKAAKA